MRTLIFLLTTLVLLGEESFKVPRADSRSLEERQSQRVQFGAILAPLIDPDKLDTLTGKRAATPRLRKACYWLNQAHLEDLDPQSVIDEAHHAAQPRNFARESEQKAALLRNLTILERLGCLGSEGLEKLRRGRAPTITKGPYTGELVTVDHIIPRSVCPELDNAIFNLEFLPDTLNKRKSAKVGERQISLAQRWHESGLLSAEGLKVTQESFHPLER